jgi:septin family protein
VTHDVHYENFRSQRLSKGAGGGVAISKAAPLSDKDIKDKMLAEKDEELRRMQVSFSHTAAASFYANIFSLSSGNKECLD